jgi:hypothetical protein
MKSTSKRICLVVPSVLKLSNNIKKKSNETIQGNSVDPNHINSFINKTEELIKNIHQQNFLPAVFKN